jgi:hypothetical protein
MLRCNSALSGLQSNGLPVSQAIAYWKLSKTQTFDGFAFVRRMDDEEFYSLYTVCGTTAGQDEGEHLCCRCVGFMRYLGSLRAEVKGSIYVVDV